MNPDTLAKAFETFLAYITQHAESMESVFETEIYEALKESLSGATREKILEIAKNTAAEMVTNISEATMRGLAETIASGLERQIHPDRLAKEIKEQIGMTQQQVQAADKLRSQLEKQGKSPTEVDTALEAFRKEKLKERAEVIANTEMRKAVSEGEYQTMKERGARFKVWISSQDGLVSDICQRNEAIGPIPIDDAFPSGHKLAPGHPDCRCSVAFITSDSQKDRASERAKDRAAKTESAKN